MNDVVLKMQDAAEALMSGDGPRFRSLARESLDLAEGSDPVPMKAGARVKQLLDQGLSRYRDTFHRKSLGKSDPGDPPELIEAGVRHLQSVIQHLATT